MFFIFPEDYGLDGDEVVVNLKNISGFIRCEDEFSNKKEIQFFDSSDTPLVWDFGHSSELRDQAFDKIRSLIYAIQSRG